MFRVSCEAPLMLALHYGARMARRGRGGIIFVSSAVSFTPVPMWTHYAASKAYTRFLGEGLYRELKSQGVDVLALCPGGMKTEFQQTAGISSLGAADTGGVVQKALRRLGKQPSVVPGWPMALLFYLLPKVLPRKISLMLFGGMISRLARHPETGGRP